MTETPGVGELSRQLSEVLRRVEALVVRMETQYVTKELAKVDRELLNEIIRGIRETIRALEESLRVHATDHVARSELNDVVNDVKDLQDDRKWIIRVVGAFVLAGILATAFVVRASGGG